MSQPWASLVAVGEKRVETRSWATAYRGPLAIHASKRLMRGGHELLNSEECDRALVKHNIDELPLGAIIAVTTLKDVLPASEVRESLNAYELSLGNFSNGRFAWMLGNVRPLAHPIEMNGALGLWPLPLTIIVEITAQQLQGD